MTGLIFGLAPALQGSKIDLNDSLRDGSRGMTCGLRHQRLRNAFVVVEIAMVLTLLAGGGLLIKNLRQLQQIKPGFDPERVLTLQLNLPETRYADRNQQNSFITQILERLAALPGVTAAGATTELPFTYSRTSNSIKIEGRAPLPRGVDLRADRRKVSADYFKAMGITLLRGRGFTASDNGENSHVAIINEQAMRRFFPNDNPLGKRLIMQGDIKYEIVGVVGDVKHGNLTEIVRPEVYTHTLEDSLRTWMDVAVRTTGSSENLIGAVRRAIRAVDPDQPVYNVYTMEQRLAGSIAADRFNALLLGVFAAVAMILAATGIYGVISYTVTQRTQEIGIRMALGAQGSNMLALVIKQGMILALIGMVIGLVVASLPARLLKDMLYQVKLMIR